MAETPKVMKKSVRHRQKASNKPQVTNIPKKMLRILRLSLNKLRRHPKRRNLNNNQ